MTQIPVTIAAALLGVASLQAQAPQSPPTSAPAPIAGASAQGAAPVDKTTDPQKGKDTPAQTPAARLPEDRRVKADEIDRLLEQGKLLVLDVREPKEIEELGGVEHALNIPIGQLEQRLGELPADRVILTACNGGGRAARAGALLERHGIPTIGFCGLSDYTGPKKVAPTRPPAVPKSPAAPSAPSGSPSAPPEHR